MRTAGGGMGGGVHLGLHQASCSGLGVGAFFQGKCVCLCACEAACLWILTTSGSDRCALNFICVMVAGSQRWLMMPSSCCWRRWQCALQQMMSRCVRECVVSLHALAPGFGNCVLSAAC